MLDNEYYEELIKSITADDEYKGKGIEAKV